MNLVRLKKWPEPQRPVFYGLTIWFLHLEKTLWPVVFAQGLVVAHLIWLTLRVQGLEVRPAAFLGLIACCWQWQRRYRAVCPQRSYALCPYLNQLPETSDEIVWHFLPKLTASKPELWNIVRSEQRSIIIGTVLTFPAWTARSVISNILRQLVTFDSAAWFYKDSRRWLLDQFPFAGTGYLGSLQDRGFLSVRAMGSVNRFHTAVIVISLLAAVHFGIRCVSAVEFRPVVLALVVALGLVANAFVCTLSGVYGRFEGRGTWLIPFCAVMLGLGAVAFERRSER